jgi:hypothetical protein
MEMIEERDRYERAFGQFRMPEPAWDRLVDRRHRKRRNQRVVAGVVGMAIFLAAIWLVSSGGLLHGTRPGTPRPTATPAPRPQTQPVDPTELPPEGAAPSMPAQGELVVGFVYGHTFGDPGAVFVNLYADGRLIWDRWDGSQQLPGWKEQRLTPEGVELMRSEFISTGLFDHDLDLTSIHGLYFGRIQVRNGDRLVRVAWGDQVAGRRPQGTTAEQAAALKRLDARLADPAAWLPARAWEDPTIRRYVASRYVISFQWREQEVPSMGLSRLLDSLPRPAKVRLRAAGITRSTYTNLVGTYEVWNASVSTEEARALDAIFRGAGVERSNEALRGPAYEVRAKGGVIHLEFFPLLPND